MAAHLAHVLWATGDWPAAEEVAAPRPRRRPRRHHDTDHRTARARLRRAGPRRLAPRPRRLEEARALGEQMGELQRLSPALWGLAETALLRGDDAGAAGWCRGGAGRLGAGRRRGLPLPVPRHGRAAHLGAGDPLAARRWVESVAGELSRPRHPRDAARDRPWPGLVLLAQGSTGNARAALEAAAPAGGAAPVLGGDLGGDRPGPLPRPIEPARRGEPDRRRRPGRARRGSGRRPWSPRPSGCSAGRGASPCRARGPR